MNNAIVYARQFTAAEFTAAEGGAFAAVAVRVGASDPVHPTTTSITMPQAWRRRPGMPLFGVIREPQQRPVCRMRQG